MKAGGTKKMKTSEMETTQEELPRYLTEKEVARMTGRSLSTLRSDRFKCQGLPYVKIGRSVRYALKDVVVFMESRKVIHDNNLDSF